MTELEQVLNKLEHIESSEGIWGVIIIISISIIFLFFLTYTQSLLKKWGESTINRELEKYKGELLLSVGQSIMNEFADLSKQINILNNNIEKKTTKEIIYHREKISLYRSSFNLLINTYLKIKEMSQLNDNSIPYTEFENLFKTIRDNLNNLNVSIYKFNLYDDTINARENLINATNLISQTLIVILESYQPKIFEWHKKLNKAQTKDKVSNLINSWQADHVNFLNELKEKIVQCQPLFDDSIAKFQLNYLDQLKVEINE